MIRRTLVTLLAAAVALSLLSAAARLHAQEKDKPVAKKENRIFELRTYTTYPGRLDALNKRFRDHTCRLFEKHGMTLIGFWTPAEGPQSENTLVYMLAFPSREARNKAFDAFRNDPEWKKAQADSEKDGKIVQKVDSRFLNPTDYSNIK